MLCGGTRATRRIGFRFNASIRRNVRRRPCGARSVTGDHDCRDWVLLMSKVYQQNAGRYEAVTACENSLRQLQTDHLDLYLSHGRGGTLLAQTVDAMTRLQQDDKITYWNVSNLDVTDLQVLRSLTGNGSCMTDQLLYYWASRGIENDLLAWAASGGYR